MKLFGNGQSGGAHTGKPAHQSAHPASPAKPQKPAVQNNAPAKKKKVRKWVYIVGAVVLVAMGLRKSSAVPVVEPVAAEPTPTGPVAVACP